MKRANMATGIIIIIAGVAVLAGIIIFGYINYQSFSHDFTPNVGNQGKKLYTSIMSVDLEEEYPQSPEQLMSLYCDTLYLMYGGFIKNRELYKDIISVQRKLYAKELQELNTPEEQYENLQNFLAALDENNVRAVDYKSHLAIYVPGDQALCYVPVEEKTVNAGNFYWRYFLVKDDAEQWKIFSWEQTDESFVNPINTANQQTTGE